MQSQIGWYVECVCVGYRIVLSVCIFIYRYIYTYKPAYTLYMHYIILYYYGYPYTLYVHTLYIHSIHIYTLYIFLQIVVPISASGILSETITLRQQATPTTPNTTTIGSTHYIDVNMFDILPDTEARAVDIAAYRSVQVTSNQVCNILFSSGTTGNNNISSIR